jgi:hypothetical protein
MNHSLEMSLPTPLLWLSLFVFMSHCLHHTWRKVFSRHGIPRTIPWGEGTEDGGFLSRGRVVLGSFFHMRELVETGQEKVWS